MLDGLTINTTRYVDVDIISGIFDHARGSQDHTTTTVARSPPPPAAAGSAGVMYSCSYGDVPVHRSCTRRRRSRKAQAHTEPQLARVALRRQVTAMTNVLSRAQVITVFPGDKPGRHKLFRGPTDRPRPVYITRVQLHTNSACTDVTRYRILLITVTSTKLSGWFNESIVHNTRFARSDQCCPSQLL